MTAPYVEGILLELLRPVLTVLEMPATVHTIKTVKYVDDAPCAVVRVLPGGGRVDPRLPVVTVPAQVDFYARATGDGLRNEREAGQALAEVAAQALVAGRGRATIHGLIVSIRTTSVPAERREAGQPDGISQWRGVWDITADAPE